MPSACNYSGVLAKRAAVEFQNLNAYFLEEQISGTTKHVYSYDVDNTTHLSF
jgi:hypothetical protein